MKKLNKNSIQKLTIEILLKKKSKINKIFLGAFLSFAITILLMKMIIGILYDCGYVNNSFHLGFWRDPKKAFGNEYNDWLTTHQSNPGWSYFLSDPNNAVIKQIITRHPSTFWLFTQFTWLTTLILIVFLSFRFFRFEDKVPKWLRWIMTQRTLSLIAMYDIIVGAVYWTSLAQNIGSSLAGGLWAANFTVTVAVHAVMPVLIAVYSVLFLIKDKKASMLRETFAFKGLIFPAIYVIYYIILTVVWYDPYPITNMHDSLMNPSLLNSSLHSMDPNWKEWGKELWKAGAALVIIYIMLGIMTVIHNLILFKFNKSYDKQKDADALYIKTKKLERIRYKLMVGKVKELNKIKHSETSLMKLKKKKK